MKRYDTIDYYGDHWGLNGFGFDKPDGSNLRFEWSNKRGWCMFGTRTEVIERSHPYFGFAVDLFLAKYGDGLDQVFRSKDYKKAQEFVAYAELHGTKSEFGWHDYGNDEFDLTLFDINQFKVGLLPPRQFIDDFGHLGIPRIVYQGELDEAFVNAVKRNDFGLQEGVVFKGLGLTKKGKPIVHYCKIKTDDWMERLRLRDPENYEKEMKQLQLHVK